MGFDAGEKLDGIELWRFLNEDEDVRVTLDGLDVFRDPRTGFPLYFDYVLVANKIAP
ncbi:hypothetical protein [Streptomyces echinatus]|uniref:hypothetical protein n=1 Tax=Streptomyces echinatus TaxID=67293 RepID=UPI0037F250DF